MGAPGPEQRKEPRYQVTYHTYLASRRQLSYTPSVERVVGLKYAKRSLLVVQNFAIFRLRHTHVRKDTRLSTAFPYCKRRKAGQGLGTRLLWPVYPGENTATVPFTKTLQTMTRVHHRAYTLTSQSSKPTYFKSHLNYLRVKAVWIVKTLKNTSSCLHSPKAQIRQQCRKQCRVRWVQIPFPSPQQSGNLGTANMQFI